MELKQVKWSDHGPAVVEVTPSAENGAFATGIHCEASIGNLVSVYGVSYTEARALESGAASLEECGIRAFPERPGTFVLDDRLHGRIEHPGVGSRACHNNVILEFDPHSSEA
jgi:hypothetical protein